MKLRFFGGAQEVGRSAIMLEEDDGSSLMMDYGVKLGPTLEYPIRIERVDGVVVSHAHLDHSGAVPVLFKNGYFPIVGLLPQRCFPNYCSRIP